MTVTDLPPTEGQGDGMGGLSQIEQFARQETDGWDVWGNAVDSSITLLRINSSASQKEKCQITKVFAIEKVSKPMYNIHRKRTKHYGGVDDVKAED